MQNKKLYTMLALAGAIPLVVGALLPLLGYNSLPLLGSLDQLVASYGLAIVCFLAGAYWGVYLAGRSAGSLNLFIISNAIFLAVWFAYVGASSNVAIGVQVLAFLALLFIDLRLRNDGAISAAYFRIRTQVTLIVVLSLLIVIVR